MDLFNKFLRILAALGEKKVAYILVGGFAVIIHGLPRLTQDIDLFIKMDEENIRKLREALNAVYQDQSIDEITKTELSRYSVIRYGTPEGFYIDLMARLGDAASYEDIESEIITVNETAIIIATPQALYELKKDIIRPEDRRDATFLKALINKKD